MACRWLWRRQQVEELEAALAAAKRELASTAEAMGRGGELGRVEAGLLADLIVVDGDPTEDIRCLEDPDRISAVMKEGVFFKAPAPVG